MKEIILARGRGIALVDDDDFERVSKHRWCLFLKGKKGAQPINDNALGYRGVRRNHRRFSASGCINYKQFYLGTFDTPEEAARVYDAFAIKNYGPFARLNFPQQKEAA